MPLTTKRFVICAVALLIAACSETATAEPTPVVEPTLTPANATVPSVPSVPSVPASTFTPIPAIPTGTPAPTFTPSPTAREVLAPTLGYFEVTAEVTPVTPVPSPVPRIKFEDDVKNVLLIGSDKVDDSGGYRSDTLIVVSINKTANTATMLSIPRDLFVFIPRSKYQMGRINSVINVAKNAPGGPIPLLEQTILYNLGIPLHYFARVDFDSFKAIVDALGGVDIPVSCTFQDNRLKDPALDPQAPENWELYTLEAGLHHLDGDTALWYARSRQISPGAGGDFDRARRQQEVLRAMFHKARESNLLLQIPALYDQFKTSVETDMTLGDVLQFVTLALSLDDLNIRSYKISPPYTQGWTTPNDGASVQLPVADDFYDHVKRVMSTGATNRASQAPFSVEIWNGTTWADAEALAAYRLGQEGLIVSIGAADRADYPTTTLIDYTTSSKASPIDDLKKLLHITDPANVIAQPDANSPVNFRVILGADYNPCTYQVAPTATPEPTATLAAETPTPGP